MATPVSRGKGRKYHPIYATSLSAGSNFRPISKPGTNERAIAKSAHMAECNDLALSNLLCKNNPVKIAI